MLGYSRFSIHNQLKDNKINSFVVDAFKPPSNGDAVLMWTDEICSFSEKSHQKIVGVIVGFPAVDFANKAQNKAA